MQMEVPIEIIYYISYFLPYDDVTAFGLTCKRHLRMVYDPKFWRTKLEQDYGKSLLLPSSFEKDARILEYMMVKPPTDLREQYLYALSLSMDPKRSVARGSERYIPLDECIERASKELNVRLVSHFVRKRAPDATPSTELLKAFKHLLQNGFYSSDLFACQTGVVMEDVLQSAFLAGSTVEMVETLPPEIRKSLLQPSNFDLAYRQGNREIIAKYYTLDYSRPLSRDYEYIYLALKYHHDDLIEGLFDHLPGTPDFYYAILTGFVSSNRVDLLMSTMEKYGTPPHHKLQALAETALRNSCIDVFTCLRDKFQFSIDRFPLNLLARSGNIALIQEYMASPNASRTPAEVEDQLRYMIFGTRQPNRLTVFKLLFEWLDKLMPDRCITSGTISTFIKEALLVRDLEICNYLIDDALRSHWYKGPDNTIVDSQTETNNLLTPYTLLELMVQTGYHGLVDRFFALHERNMIPIDKERISSALIMAMDRAYDSVVDVILKYNPNFRSYIVVLAMQIDNKRTFYRFLPSFNCDELDHTIVNINLSRCLRNSTSPDWSCIIDLCEAIYRQGRGGILDLDELKKDILYSMKHSRQDYNYEQLYGYIIRLTNRVRSLRKERQLYKRHRVSKD